ncbi:MAG: uracil-DNA glycosylase [Cyanobacteria bacterium K_Offshore_surface_m2_239]|nr:uracil-DNA glycosylase [Cyanobacteria bacterium K_Offshore_surface_m2_239]
MPAPDLPPASASSPAPDPPASPAGPPAGPAVGQGVQRREPPLPALEALARACADCRRCPLAAGRQQVVVSRGNPSARLMVIGEGPGAQEDAQGLPFVGRAGQLLDQMLASVGLDSNRDAYICNVVKCRPPDNRKPTPEEMAACRPWLLEQIDHVDPALIVLAGATALEGVLGIRGGITRLRGQWRAGEGEGLAGRWLVPIFHPSYLLRNASREAGSPKWHTWQDLKELRRRLDLLGG